MILKSKCSEFQSDWRLFFVHGLLTASAVVGSSGGATGIRALYLAPPAVPEPPAQAQQQLQSHQPRGKLKRLGHETGHQFAGQSSAGQLL